MMLKDMKTVMLVFGTRPEAIKMCPLVLELQTRKEIRVVVCVTGQHREMLQQVLDVFGVVPSYNLGIMKTNQTLFDITQLIMEKLRPVILKENPDVCLVHGDTTTTFAAALTCFYMKIPVGHVEAGLRTYNMNSPYPEEFNRQAVDNMTTFYFAPTEQSKRNLLGEHKDEKQIFVTGNTGIDALRTTVSKNYSHPLLKWATENESKLILLTAHRRENLETALKNIFMAVKEILREFPEVRVIYPIHKNPYIQELANSILGELDRVKLIDPLDVIDFHNIMAHAYLIMTDSGGIQEEAPSLGKPVLVMRDTTERPEGVEAGTLKLVGTNCSDIIEMVKKLLINENHIYDEISHKVNPYGDGYSSRRIADILLQKLSQI